MTKPEATTEPIYYYCNECRAFFTEHERINECLRFGHTLRRRTPIEKRICCQSGGNIVIEVDDQNFNVIPILTIFANPKAHPETFSNPSLALMGVKSNWNYIGTARLQMDLTNLAKKLTYSCGQQSCLISKEELKQLLVEAVKNGRFEEFGNSKNIVVVRLALSTDLEKKPPNSTSKWVVVTKKELLTCLPSDAELEAQYREIVNKPIKIDRRRIEAGVF